ncbi:MAG: hypothetical protein MJY44_02945 [Bacteroidales bacterium]|nr:hypothetical protein [Bacteroidales bacterium]
MSFKRLYLIAAVALLWIPAAAQSSFPWLFPQRTKTGAAVILPLGTAGNPSDNMFEFYNGVLLAARDLGLDGNEIDLSTINLSEGRAGIFDLDSKSLSLGPVCTGDIKQVLSMSMDSLFHVVSPLEPRVLSLVDSMRVIHTPTPVALQAKSLADWLESELAPEDIVLVATQKGEAPDEFSALLLSELTSRHIRYSSLCYEIQDALNASDKYTALSSPAGVTRIIAASASESFCADVLRNVNLLQYKERRGVLYCNSRLRSFQSIETENMHSACAHMVSGYFIDYKSPEVRKFVYAYRALFGCEPGSFAFHGYDVAHYFLGLSSKYGRFWKERMPYAPWEGLQSGFIFSNDYYAGKVNTAVRRILYNPDHSITAQ